MRLAVAFAFLLCATTVSATQQKREPVSVGTTNNEMWQFSTPIRPRGSDLK